MAKQSLSFHDKRPVVVSLIALSGLAVFCYGVTPFANRFFELRKESKKAAERLNNLRAIASRGAIIQETQRSIDKFWSNESKEESQRRFLDELETMARNAQVQISLKPRPYANKDQISRFSVEIDIDAEESRLLSFLDALLRDDSLLEIERLRISSQSSRTFPLRSNILVTKFVITRN